LIPLTSDSTSLPKMDKSSLRAQYLARRKSLSSQDHLKKSQSVTKLFIDSIPLSKYRSLHTFLPIEKKREVDTFLLIRQLRKRYPKLLIVVPKIHKSGLEHYILRENTLLQPGPYFIPEPQKAESFDQLIDVAVVPMLIFDRKGHRIGYGKGYYDRFLATCHSALKIGLSLFPPVDQIPELTSTDVALDIVITPKKLYKFSI